MITWKDIEKMSPEEQAALQTTLAKQALGKFLLTMGLKWGIIIGIGILGRKLYNSLPEE